MPTAHSHCSENSWASKTKVILFMVFLTVCAEGTNFICQYMCALIGRYILRCIAIRYVVKLSLDSESVIRLDTEKISNFL